MIAIITMIIHNHHDDDQNAYGWRGMSAQNAFVLSAGQLIYCRDALKP